MLLEIAMPVSTEYAGEGIFGEDVDKSLVAFFDSRCIMHMTTVPQHRRQTDGRTTCHDNRALFAASRGKNIIRKSNEQMISKIQNELELNKNRNSTKIALLSIDGLRALVL